jgi:Baseplate J-like protein
MTTTAQTVCPCDGESSAPATNLPGLAAIAYRAGDFNDFRRALLTPLLPAPGQPPLELSLNVWQSGVGADPTVPDMGVMMAEWWAYISDILTFYNERIANEDYLRTAVLPETPGQLVRLLGYRPRPAIGATGSIAALVSPSLLPGQTVTLPAGLQFQSKPTPGQSPQTFELAQQTMIGRTDKVAAMPPAALVGRANGNNTVLVQGKVTTVSKGSPLLLGTRDNSAAPTLINVNATPMVQTVTGAGKQTMLQFAETPAAGLMAATARLTMPNQMMSLWTLRGTVVDGEVIQLAGLARQIRANDWLVLAAGMQYELAQVASVTDMLGDAGTSGTATSVGTGTGYTPIPVLHTQITLMNASAILTDGAKASESVLFGMVEVGVLVDQPPATWDGVSSELAAVQPAQFAPGNSFVPVMLQDSNGVGAAGSAEVAGDGGLGLNWPSAAGAPFSPGMQPPINVFYNLLPVTRGKTIANEIIGSGDGTITGQSFKLAKSPVTYLTVGSTYASTIKLRVNGQPWTEVSSFYGQPANAQVFVTREDAQQNTYVDFGDGINGARLPTGSNNVVATYRIEAGADSPPAGKLTVIAQSYPGLQSVVNPVPVSGGSDPDPASLLRQYAPQSVLTFGRAVSVYDYQALAAGAPGVTRAQAVWSWNAANQQAGATVYVAGEPGVATSVQTLLNAAGGPDRPVWVWAANEIKIALTLDLIVKAGMDQGAMTAGVIAALCDPMTGLFSPAKLGIGQALFDSMIEAAVLSVDGLIAIKSSTFAIDQWVDAGPLHNPGEGAFFSLDPASLAPSMEVTANG